MKDFLATATTNLQWANEALADAIGAAERDKDLHKVLRLFTQARDAYEKADQIRKLVYTQLEYLSRTVIPERMLEDGVNNITLDGLRYTISNRSSTTMTDKEAGIDWLRENGHGDIVQATVNANTLAAFARRYLEDTGKDLPDNMFKTTAMKVTSVTKT